MKIYPKTIKQIKNKNIELNHFVVLDDFGFERDLFELIKYNKNGSKSILPFFPKVVVNNYSRKNPIKFTNNYTEKDYEDMFEENKTRLLAK